MTTYNVRRFYLDDNRPTKFIKRGLSLEEAQAHCADPETSSATCKSKLAKRHTETHGAWFDGYEEDRAS